jgi:small subunit ribosomal protein S7
VSRKSYVKTQQIIPDAKYRSELIARFINRLMVDGKKSIAEKIFYSALDTVKEKTNEDPVEVFQQAFLNVKPAVEVKSRRVGGATYQVPIEVRPQRQDTLAIRWMITYARGRSEKSMELRLANEIMDAYKNTGNTVKKREDTHKMAEANKAFSHFRW